MSEFEAYSVGCAKCGQYAELKSMAEAEAALRSMKKDRDLFGRSVDHSHDGLAIVARNEFSI